MNAIRMNALSHIAERLDGGNALNNSISVGLFLAHGAGEKSVHDIVQIAVGKCAQVRSIAPCSEAELVAEIRKAFEYEGDYGAHPNLNYLGTKEFSQDLGAAIQEVKSVVEDASNLWTITLSEGHPFYPVYWDFAFVYTNNEGGGLIVGSCSD